MATTAGGTAYCSNCATYNLQSRTGSSYQQLVAWLPAGSRAALPDGGILSGLSDPVAYGGLGHVLLLPASTKEEEAS